MSDVKPRKGQLVYASDKCSWAKPNTLLGCVKFVYNDVMVYTSPESYKEWIIWKFDHGPNSMIIIK